LRKESHSREKSNSSAAAEKDEKRRKRERNAERWRRVRAREAAHDAPVRRWAKVAYSRWGARGAMGAALAFALVLRVMLTLVALCTYTCMRLRKDCGKAADVQISRPESSARFRCRSAARALLAISLL
jgi:hypothetical protein